jgi:hypothetical protein
MLTVKVHYAMKAYVGVDVNVNVNESHFYH